MSNKTKIFCIGLNKTGTSSLHEAFKILGYNSVHFKDDQGNNIKTIIRDNYLNGDNILKGLEQYDAFSDWDRIDTHKCFKEFDQQYPNSKFILNTRSLKDWLKSRKKHVMRNQERKRKNPDLPIKWFKVNRRAWAKHYKRHHREVYNYFKGRENELLVFDVTKGDGWEKLCSFLEVKVPEIPFPRKNVAAKLQTPQTN